MLLRRLAALLPFAAAACASGAPRADLVVYGRVWTGDSAQVWAGAVAVHADTILAVGDSTTIAALVGPSTRVLNNGSALVTPGFMDGHVHFLDGGAAVSRVNLRDASTPAEFVGRLKAFAATQPKGTWILGGEWDHEAWPGAPLPTRAWIDSVTPDHPVFVSRLDGHMAVANSAALKLARIDALTPDITGGTIVRGAENVPTGVLKDAAQTPVYDVIPPPTAAEADKMLAAGMQWANARGVTAVASVSVTWPEAAAWRRAHDAGAQTVRATLYPPLANWKLVADTVAKYGVGDDRLRLAGVKGYVDGSLGSTTALFYEPYQDDKTTTGLLVTPEDSLRRWIGAADSAKLQVIVHAIGERANGMLLDIFDSVTTAHGARDRRFRIEHAQHLRAQDMDRIAASGVIASMQPYHLPDDGRWAFKRIRPDQVERTYAFHSLLERKARLAFGSDWVVAPIEPLFGIWAAVTRRTNDGKHPEGWTPAEKISVEDALRAYTAGNAYAVFADATRGVLRRGAQADLVLLGADLTRIAPDGIKDVAVQATIMGGKVVYIKDAK